MIFTSKPSAILYLRHHDAVLITKGASVRLDINTALVQNLEVLDETKTAEHIAQFLENHKIHGQQMLLVLDHGVVLQKTVPVTKDNDVQVARQDFESKLPFDPENKQVLSLTQNDQITFLGVNKLLCQSIARGIQKSNKLKGIVPALAYGIHEGQKVDREAIAAFFNNGKALRKTNFLTKM